MFDPRDLLKGVAGHFFDASRSLQNWYGTETKAPDSFPAANILRRERDVVLAMKLYADGKTVEVPGILYVTDDGENAFATEEVWCTSDVVAWAKQDGSEL